MLGLPCASGDRRSRGRATSATLAIPSLKVDAWGCHRLDQEMFAILLLVWQPKYHPVTVQSLKFDSKYLFQPCHCICYTKSQPEAQHLSGGRVGSEEKAREDVKIGGLR